jgi:hypothetical protein
MKSIIDEAINAFNQNHEDRCLDNIIQCEHGIKISMMKKYQREVNHLWKEQRDREQPIRQEIANKLAENRNHWIAAKTPNEASAFTWALNDIFNLAIKFALEEE